MNRVLSFTIIYFSLLVYNPQYIISLSINLLNQEYIKQQQIDQILTFFHLKATSSYQSKLFIVHRFNESYSSQHNYESSLKINQQLIDTFHWINGYYSMYTISIEYSDMISIIKSLNSTMINDPYQSVNLLNRYINRQYLPITMYLFDSSIDQYYFIELPYLYIQNPIKLKDFLYKRQQVKITFTLDSDYPNPIELRWVNYRGNTQILELDSITHAQSRLSGLIIQPGMSTIQYTNGGHVYAIMKETNSIDHHHHDNNSGYTYNTCNFSNDMNQSNYLNNDFTSSMEFHRIIGLYMIPTAQNRSFQYKDREHHYQLFINPKKHPFFNIDDLLRYNKLPCECIDNDMAMKHPTSYPPPYHQEGEEVYYSKILKMDWFVSSNPQIMLQCFRESIMNYWESQRLSQISINTWAVPSITTTSSTQLLSNYVIDSHKNMSYRTDNILKSTDYVNDINNTTAAFVDESLWTLFTLPSTLLIKLKEAYNDQVSNNHIYPEPPISLVFNQHHTATYYIPLPNHLLSEVNSFVHSVTAQWLNISMEQILITSSYGFREYRNNAVIRWHVDPVNTQPLTAIINIIHDRDWTLQISKLHTPYPIQCTDFSTLFTPISSIQNQNTTSIHISMDQNNCMNNLDDTTTATSEYYDEIYLKEGQGVLLQSGKLPHARIKPYQGYSYANIFVHFAEKRWIYEKNIIDLD